MRAAHTLVLLLLLLTMFARLLTALSTDQPPLCAGGGAGCLPRTDEPPGGPLAVCECLLGLCCRGMLAARLQLPSCHRYQLAKLPPIPACKLPFVPHPLPTQAIGRILLLPPSMQCTRTDRLAPLLSPPAFCPYRLSAKSCCCRSRTPWSCAQRCDSPPSLEMWQRCVQRCDSCPAFSAAATGNVA